MKKILTKKKLNVDFIASHGHTIFHQPQKGFTAQLGSGAHLAAASGLSVVSDFRSLDVALGGQGAPLVPLGDKLLFGQYTYCLNLGGIANISFDKGNKRIAGDVCPVNIVLNKLAEEKGKVYDKGGKLAEKGKINASLLKKLEAKSFYKKTFPKSLGREWVDQEIFPLLNRSKLSIEDKLATYCEHVALRIAAGIDKNKKSKLFITGGGAFNTFLISRIKANIGNTCQVIIPEALVVSYKEALIFAFLGLKRWNEKINTLKSVTGATKDSIGGAIYLNY